MSELQVGVPKVSVIIPIYNREKYLRDCLNSVKKQDFSALEVICVNDGSTDMSGEICDEFVNADSRFHVIHQTNLGTHMARKNGVKIAQGDFIMFLDADDKFLPGAVKMAYEGIIRENVDMLQFGVELSFDGDYSNDDKNGLIKYFSPIKNKISDNNKIIQMIFMDFTLPHNIWAFIFKKNIVKSAYENSINEHLTMGEDGYILLLICHYAKSLSAIQQKCYFYNIGTGATGKKSPLGGLVNTIRCVPHWHKALLAFAKEHDASPVFTEASNKFAKHNLELMVSWIPRLKSEKEQIELLKYILDSAESEQILQILINKYVLLQKAYHRLTSRLVWKIIKFFYLPLKKIKEKIPR